MKKIYIRTTNSCNLNCKQCYARTHEPFIVFDPEKTANYVKNYIRKFITGEYELHDEILISFHGGEPFLNAKDMVPRIQKFINILTDEFASNYIYYDATTNLIMNDTEIHLLADLIKNNNFTFNGKPFIKISWDAGDVRFYNEAIRNQWYYNISKLKSLIPDIYLKVNICLTKDLLTIYDINTEGCFDRFFTDINAPYIDELHFERLTGDGALLKKLAPSYDDIDEWMVALCRNLLIYKRKILVDNFEGIKAALNGFFVGCTSRACMEDVITINANGTVGGCPNTSMWAYFEDIEGKLSPKHFCDKFNKCCLEEKNRRQECLLCEYYKICNGECFQLPWQGHRCPGMKKVMKCISEAYKNEYSK